MYLKNSMQVAELAREFGREGIYLRALYENDESWKDIVKVDKVKDVLDNKMKHDRETLEATKDRAVEILKSAIRSGKVSLGDKLVLLFCGIGDDPGAVRHLVTLQEELADLVSCFNGESDDIVAEKVPVKYIPLTNLFQADVKRFVKRR
ncbi:hypothetical protein J3459_007643 [Metarhizium acridum]|uniref:uncharacterized protein n=1 Tax=Metarhizium acridum TaxID=92637 RepID=UPI001C6B7059|nr:hypothetical protein J3458_007104 [Metarhizium acridum]KAG8426975.1 hypothetical protein J3459_007643 [Metarhizium acridum]